MNKKIIQITACFLVIFFFLESNTYSYSIESNSVGNKIIIDIVNKDNHPKKDLILIPTHYPEWVRFNNEAVTIDNIEKKGHKEVEISFDILNAKPGEIGAISFLVIKGNHILWSKGVTLRVIEPPSVPVITAITQKDLIVSLSWKASHIENGIKGYNVYRSEISEGPYNKIVGLINETHYYDNSVENGKIYYYVVTAVDNKDCESGYSNEKSIRLTRAKENLENVITFPTPWTQDSEKNYIVFRNLTPMATVKIFSVSGKLVNKIEEKDGDGEARWYLDNISQKIVCSGVYLYSIEGNNCKREGKIVIIK